MDLLDDLGTQLRALSADQPAQPGDRVPGVARTARRIRRTRAAVAVAAAAAVLAPAGLLVSGSQHHEATSFADTNVLTWPDRSVPAEAGIGEGAVAALEEHTGAAVLDVQWLYRARVHRPVDNPAYVAVFIAEVQGQDLLVAATSVGHELDEHGLAADGDNRTPQWDTSDRTVLEPSKPLGHVGLYLPYNQDDQHLSYALVLADPRARRLTWTVNPLPFAPDWHDVATPMESVDGVFAAPLGRITGPVTVRVSSRDRDEASFPLASGTSQPNLSAPEAPVLPGGWAPTLSGQGQTEQASPGHWNASTFSIAIGDSRRASTAMVRCYGGGSVHVTVELGESTKPAAAGDVACDGESHQAFPTVNVGNVQELLTVTGDRLQVLNLAFGSIR